MTDMNALPENCIAKVLSLTSPPDACRLSLVSPTFKLAAESDAVWEAFLPSDYEDMIARASSSSQLVFASKKELYLRLCDHPLIINGGNMSFSLDKWSGKKCFMLSARYLTIVWGDTPHCWKWPSLQESRFTEVAELVRVCWLEIRAEISTQMLSPDTTYAAYLVFNWKRASGFGHQPADCWVGISGSEVLRNFYLDPRRHESYEGRGDGWLEIELGEHFNQSGEDGELDIRLLDEKGAGSSNNNWKCGLIVQGIEIRPKNSNQMK